MDQIGQTALKDFLAYERGDECGLKFEAKHITGTYPDKPNEKQGLGHYAEFLLFGTVPAYLKRQGKIPMPDFLATTEKANKPETLAAMWKAEHETFWMNVGNTFGIMKDYTERPFDKLLLADYRRLHEKLWHVARMLHEIKFEIVTRDEEHKNEWGRGRTDIRAKSTLWDGIAVVDAKYTGLAREKWSPYGFLFELQNQIDHHGFQAKQYHLLTGEPFYYLLISSSKDENFAEFVEAEFTDSGLLQHREMAMEAKDKINIQQTIGFVARPSLERCNDCELRSTCKFRSRVPQVRKVIFNSYEKT